MWHQRLEFASSRVSPPCGSNFGDRAFLSVNDPAPHRLGGCGGVGMVAVVALANRKQGRIQ